MSVAQFIQYATDALFLLIFLVVLTGAIRRRRRVQIQALLFFGTVAFILVESLIFNHFEDQPPAFVAAVNQIMLISMSYLLLRLVASLSDVPRVVFRIGEVGLVLLGVQTLVGLGDQRFSFIIPAVLYFLGFTIYATIIAINESRRVQGVTGYRLRAVAFGSAFLAAIILVAGIAAFVPAIVGNTIHIIDEILALLCGFSYFIAFATPVTLRRAWLEPVLRDYFGKAVVLPQLADRREMIQRLEASARDSLGGIAASVALWDEQTGELFFPTNSIGIANVSLSDSVEGAAFRSQTASFWTDFSRKYPDAADVYLRLDAKSVISAPVTSRGHPYGVMSVYFAGEPFFIEDDLTLLQLMADQAGVVLESRSLVEEETRLRAREQALELRNDFLASVAHDLKTPLTALVMQTQLLERRARRSPETPADAEGLHQIIVQTHRLRSFIEDLLDVQRSEDEGLSLNYEPCNLGALAGEIGGRVCVEPHRFVLEADPEVRINGDRARLTQVFDNLIGNAVKYSPDGGEIRVRIWQENDNVHASVSDEGIGISPHDLPHIYERHHRGDNAKAEGVHGIGLGLFICRAIVQAHGGTLNAESEPGRGSTFHLVMPCDPSVQREPAIGPWMLPNDTAQPVAGDVAVQNRMALGGGSAN